MSVWYAIPSKRPAKEANATLEKWREREYKIAVWRDIGDSPVKANLLVSKSYPGYARAVNGLCARIFAADQSAEWIVTGGDDVLPDHNHSADEIALECTKHFVGTLGVMQPTGDGHGIETICGSPWMGCEWCIRINGGNGPFHPGYFHMFCDQEMQEVATMMGVLWQRSDLSHTHNHWAWTTGVMPKFLARANSSEHWHESKNLFNERKSRNFPGHGLVPVSEMIGV